MIRLILLLTSLALPLSAQEAPVPEATPEATPDAIPDAPEALAEREPPMTYERLGRIIFALDPEAQPAGPAFQMSVAGLLVIVVTDQQSDRMRVMVPIRQAADLTAEDMMRMMQANFDSALDARYGVANGTLWSVFIHPLSPLQKDQFISGLGQVVNAAQTYGTLYSGGAMQFGAGDSGTLQRELIEELLKRGEEL